MLLSNKLIIILLITFQFLNGCTSPKEIYYSYKVVTYTIDDTSRYFFYSDDLISYGDYLFEFRKRKNIKSKIESETEKITTIDYDTIGVYLLSNRNIFFFEFDTFSLRSHVVKRGKLIEKEKGFKFNSLDNESSSDLSFTRPSKIKINNINFFVSEIISKNKKENDSTIQKAILIKNIKFNSLYKINGIKFPDKNYCIIGFNNYDIKRKQFFSQDIVELRPLTKNEMNICNSLIEKSELFVVNTL